MPKPTSYEIFLSYARLDNRVQDGQAQGWVTALRDQILEDHRRFSTAPLRIFLDVEEIRDMDDWRHRILGGLRESKILLVCLSPNYLASDYCRWEWEEYCRRQAHNASGRDSVTTVYFVEVPGVAEPMRARWLDSVLRGNFTDIRPWFPEGPETLRREDVRRSVARLGERLWERIERARRATGVPGNLRSGNPYFVGRTEELRQLHERLALGTVGVVTAVHGIGGQGKTELAVTYARAWAHCYPAGLWALGAEGRRELLALLGELAYSPELNYRPSEAEKADANLLGRAVLAELGRRVESLRQQDPSGLAAALVLLDNVSEPELLSPSQLAALPRADWLHLVATTRLDPGRLDHSGKWLATVAVDAMEEDDALALVREHQPPRDPAGLVPGFASAHEEAAARAIVRELGGFTLAVEQVAAYLGLHPDLTPTAFLAGLRRRGLASADRLGCDEDVRARMLHQGKQLSAILDATLKLLDPPARTALRIAALLPSDAVPWPWLHTLVVARHPELKRQTDDEPDPWLTTRRRLEGLRLLTSGEQPELARIHRLIAAHLVAAGEDALASGDLVTHVTSRADWISDERSPPENWEVDALVLAIPHLLAGSIATSSLAIQGAFLAQTLEKRSGIPKAIAVLDAAETFIQKRLEEDSSDSGFQWELAVCDGIRGDVQSAQGNLPAAFQSYQASLQILQRLADADPGNAVWRRDLSVSHITIGDVQSAQGNLPAALQSYQASLQIRRRLADADPGNAEWQRDLWVCYERMARISEAMGLSEAQDWWERAYDRLSSMKEAGIFLSPDDEAALASLKAKVTELRDRRRVSGFGGSPPHPLADANRTVA
jgi:tetratricopeptide (TPR) repeat protein